MSELTYSISLTGAELLLLDGRCSGAVQDVVNRVKSASDYGTRYPYLTESERLMLARIVAWGTENGFLSYRGQEISQCQCCNRKDGYWPVHRTTKWKRRGQPDLDRPKVFTGYRLDFEGVSIQNYIGLGVCETCSLRVLPAAVELLSEVRCDLSAIQGEAARWRRVEKYACGACGWEGLETAVGREPSIFGNGTYPGRCPSCGSVRHPLDLKGKKTIHGTGKYHVVERMVTPK